MHKPFTFFLHNESPSSCNNHDLLLHNTFFLLIPPPKKNTNSLFVFRDMGHGVMLILQRRKSSIIIKDYLSTGFSNLFVKIHPLFLIHQGSHYNSSDYVPVFCFHLHLHHLHPLHVAFATPVASETHCNAALFFS